ncbi:hypothetical protein B0H14DRAFT_2619515 [Mycena olivaceomarginata]|nr:hypothetical protein B0H14DRAFT_2619515 [Mycena olivaceomarginata]
MPFGLEIIKCLHTDFVPRPLSSKLKLAVCLQNLNRMTNLSRLKSPQVGAAILPSPRLPGVSLVETIDGKTKKSINRRQEFGWLNQGSRRRTAMKAEEYASEEHAVSVKDAHAAYRVKNREILAFKARVRRQNAFIAKHGIQAHHDRIAKERASADAAWQAQLAENERQREARREARKAARQSSSTTVN